MNVVFLDSGVGGIPYLLSLKEKNPSCTCAYLADTLHFPYGEKSSAEIIEFAREAVSKIETNFHPDVLVIACNTISVSALVELRKQFPKQIFVGTVPAIKKASEVTKNKRIGLLATNATVNDSYLKKLIADFANDCTIVNRGDADLVSFIEHKFCSASECEIEEAITPALDFFARENCDTIVLGCTHFTHLADVMQKKAGSAISIVDSRDGVARHALSLLAEKRNVSDNIFSVAADFLSDVHDTSFFVTGFPSNDAQSEQIYRAFCSRFHLKYCGIIDN